MRRFNVHSEVEYDPEPDGYRAGYAKLHPEIGAATLFGGLFELPPGEASRPYHYESGEEWLLVLAGRLTVRHPEGEDELVTGDLVCFPAGPDGAHKLTKQGDEPVRMLIVSTANLPSVAVYPDSDKIGVWTPGRTDNIMVRRESGVNYYDGET